MNVLNANPDSHRRGMIMYQNGYLVCRLVRVCLVLEAGSEGCVCLSVCMCHVLSALECKLPACNSSTCGVEARVYRVGGWVRLGRSVIASLKCGVRENRPWKFFVI